MIQYNLLSKKELAQLAERLTEECSPSVAEDIITEAYRKKIDKIQRRKMCIHDILKRDDMKKPINAHAHVQLDKKYKKLDKEFHQLMNIVKG